MELQGWHTIDQQISWQALNNGILGWVQQPRVYRGRQRGVVGLEWLIIMLWVVRWATAPFRVQPVCLLLLDLRLLYLLIRPLALELRAILVVEIWGLQTSRDLLKNAAVLQGEVQGIYLAIRLPLSILYWMLLVVWWMMGLGLERKQLER
jgi:hypothetical protein